MTVGFSFDVVQQEDNNILANSLLEGHGTVWSLQFLALLAYADPLVCLVCNKSAGKPTCWDFQKVSSSVVCCGYVAP